MASQVENRLNERQAWRRYSLSLVIVVASIGILAWVFSKDYSQNSELSADTIFTAIVGLVGTWVGTILAFYYSKDNFEAASKSTQDLVDKITMNKLDTIPAKQAMIGINKLNYLKFDEGKEYLLKDLLSNEQYLKKYNRLPVLSSDLSPKYIVYRSVIDKYIASKSLNDEDIKSFTLKSVAEDPVYSKYFKAFIAAKEDDPLSFVKSLMERMVIDKDENEDVLIADVFITETGTVKSPVIGWLTNVDINKLSKV